MYGIINLITQIIETIMNGFVTIFVNIFSTNSDILSLTENSFNIYLFSEKGFFTEPINLMDLVGLILFTFLLVFLVRLLWKGTKKFFSLIMEVFRF